MTERDIATIMRGVGPVLRQQYDALERRLVHAAEQAEALRDAEHRAFMAEQREAMTTMLRQIDVRLDSVRDGVDGQPGRDGADGAPGQQGERGPQGEPGRDGIDGVNGRDGANGAAGPAGSDGAAGPAGADGVPGPAGANGNDGAPGRTGDTGPQGDRGQDDIDGQPGRDGMDGAAGRDGAIGPQGESGRDGVDGVNGRNGQDAYAGQARGLFDPQAEYRAMDVVSFNGSEWRAKQDRPGDLPGDGWMLSASRGKRGEKGDRGDRGTDGPTGAAGADAAAVIAGYVDSKELGIVLTKEDGSEVKIDLYDFAAMVRGT